MTFSAQAGEIPESELGPATAGQSSVIFLPVFYQPDRFEQQTHPIWAHNHIPDEHEVVLFRRTFTLNSPVEDAELAIFADTRYQVWFNGALLGRGPARFLDTYREYDRYALGDLPSGKHQIAVLAQWAPNTRRSESVTPILRAALSAYAQGRSRQILATDSSWRVLPATAWQSGAVPVHTWGLIGPTELLDLQKLPQDWVELAYVDTQWQPAQVRDETGAYLLWQSDAAPRDLPWSSPQTNSGELVSQAATLRYTTRSIAALEQVPMPVQVIAQGILAPDRWMLELPWQPEPYSLAFNLANPQVVAFERLSSTYAPAVETIYLDGNPISWTASTRHVDIQQAQINLSAGRHSLTVSSLPEHGVTLSVGRTGLVWEQRPFSQGLHAGRRLLLADYQPVITAIQPAPAMNEPLVLQNLPGYVLLDLGRSVHGRLQITAQGPAGTIIDIGWDERLQENFAVPLPFPGSLHSEWNQVDSWVLDGNSRTFTTIDARSGRYILIACWGPGPITLTELSVFEERYPVGSPASFSSSNALLDQVWQVGVETLYPNMTDALTDTPWRERGQWWGDAYVTEQANRAVFNNPDLFHRGLLLMSLSFENGRPTAMAPNGNGLHMLDYGMLWLHGLQEYQSLSGDTEFARQRYPVVVDFMAYLESFQNSETGLLDLPVGSWAETAYIDSNAQLARSGQSAPVNAMYYYTLLQAARLANLVGEQQQASLWRQQAQQVQAAMQSVLYLPAEGRYLTSVVAGSPIGASVYSLAWPLAYGVVPADQVDRVVAALLAELESGPTSQKVNVYGLFWVLKALGKAGYVQSGVELIEQYYGYVLQAGATTWWEHFDSGQYYYSSLSHAWGSAPNWFLSAYVLGAQQTGPDSWALKPGNTDLEQVNGHLPLGEAQLRINWQKAHDCTHGSLTVVSPPGYSGVIELPNLSQTLQVSYNGKLIWQNISAAQSNPATLTPLSMVVGPGWHYFELSPSCPSNFNSE